MKSYRQLTRAA